MVIFRRRKQDRESGDNNSCDIKEEKDGVVSSSSILEPPSWNPKLLEDWRIDIGKSVIQRLFHWGTLTALFLIFFIGYMASWLSLSWWPINTVGGFIHFAIFLFWNYATLNNFFKAVYMGAGYLPREWIPDLDGVDEHLQYCKECKGYKAPRSHHCSKCGRCVLKMDHHCPWINNCVGHRNHANFVFFLLYASTGCFHACIIIMSSLYHAVNLNWYTKYATQGTYPIVQVTLLSFISSILAAALAAGVALAVGVLLVIQIKGIWKNCTALEDYIISKAEHIRNRDEEDDDEDVHPPFIYPYNLGWKRNIKEVLGTFGIPLRNGVWWPIVEGTNQFTLTEEQLRQKEAKRERARLVYITHTFKGGWWRSIPLGPRTFFCQPLTEEPRVEIKIGDRWMVTRGQKYWLYGKKCVDNDEDEMKGWFPRRYAALVERSTESEEDVTTTDK